MVSRLKLTRTWSEWMYVYTIVILCRPFYIFRDFFFNNMGTRKHCKKLLVSIKGDEFFLTG